MRCEEDLKRTCVGIGWSSSPSLPFSPALPLSPGYFSSSPPQAESWCHTHLKVIRFSYVWVIENFSFCREDNGEALRSSVFCSAQDESLKW